MVAIAWIGFDKPASLGDRETGGGLALPMWISYMGTALKDVPQISREVPSGVTQLDGDWYVPDFATNGGVRELY